MNRNNEDNSLTIHNDNKTITTPFENIKCFAYLKEEGKGINLELLIGNTKKIESYEYDDSIVDRAVLEFNKCLDTLLIEESLISSSIL